MSASAIIDRLSGVKQTAPGRWLAKCPAHEDRSPSLSIRELDDGRLLLHDFGGCDTEAVLDALGLSLADLFERPLRGTGPAGGFASTRARIPAGEALAALDHEVSTAYFVISNASRGAMTEGNLERLAQAARRIGAARDLYFPLAVRRSA